MRETYNYYCDESCHLESDDSNVMVIGTIYCPKGKRKEVFTRMRDIKVSNGLSPKFEIKWNKVSPGKTAFYRQIIDYFFDDDDLHFRAIVVPNKKDLKHSEFGQTHDDFYYKMYFDMLKVVLNTECSNHIYIDIKDTKSQDKVLKLKEILRNQHYDYKKEIIKFVQQVRSDEVEIMQMTDLLIGALSYLHRGLSSSTAKLNLIKRIQSRSGYSLMKNTLLRENKTNLLIWKSKYGG